MSWIEKQEIEKRRDKDKKRGEIDNEEGEKRDTEKNGERKKKGK